MNSLLKLGLSIAALGLGIELATKKPNKKELTPNSESDNVQVPNANDVPKPNETETQSNVNDDSGITDSGDVV